MATLTIERSSEWANKIRNIGIYVDGEKLGVVADGEIRSFDIAAGTHTIISKIDWCSSRELSFEITEERGKTFTLSSFAYKSWWKIFLAMYYTILQRKDYLKMEEVFI